MEYIFLIYLGRLLLLLSSIFALRLVLIFITIHNILLALSLLPIVNCFAERNQQILFQRFKKTNSILSFCQEAVLHQSLSTTIITMMDHPSTPQSKPRLFGTSQIIWRKKVIMTVLHPSSHPQLHHFVLLTFRIWKVRYIYRNFVKLEFIENN